MENKNSYANADVYHIYDYFRKDTDTPINTHINSVEDNTLHDHSFYEIVYLQNGNVIHAVNGQEMDLEYGDIVFFRPRDVHIYKKHRKKFSHRDIMIEKEFFESTLDFMNPHILKTYNSPVLPVKLKITTEEINHYEKLITEIANTLPEDGTNRITLSKIFLVDIMSFFYKKTQISDTENNFPFLIKKIIENLNILSNYSVGLKKILSDLPYSRSYLCRLFKTHVGITMTDYMNNVRLNYVANQLKLTKKTVVEICYEVGFSSISHFNKLFKSKYGVSPLKYRYMPKN